MNNNLYRVLEVLNKWKGNEDALLHDGTQLICRTLQESPLGYLHKLYPPLNTIDIEKMEVLLKVSLPMEYLDFLLTFNGMELFSGNIIIFGIRKISDNNTVNKFFQPYDIILENLDKKFPDDCFLFAYYKRKYEVFFKSGSKKVIVKLNDTIVGEFVNFYDWLNYCINELSPYFDQFGKLIKEIR